MYAYQYKNADVQLKVCGHNAWVYGCLCTHACLTRIHTHTFTDTQGARSLCFARALTHTHATSKKMLPNKTTPGCDLDTSNFQCFKAENWNKTRRNFKERNKGNVNATSAHHCR